MKLSLILLATCIAVHAADSLPPLKKVPQNVTELWAGYDPQKEPLRTEVVREWEEDGVVVRYLRYYIGSFKGKSAWMAAFYAFPNIEGTGMTSNILQEKLLNEAGVAAISGTSFGAYGEGYLRFSYANSTVNIREAMARIRDLMAT